MESWTLLIDGEGRKGTPAVAVNSSPKTEILRFADPKLLNHICLKGAMERVFSVFDITSLMIESKRWISSRAVVQSLCSRASLIPGRPIDE